MAVFLLGNSVALQLSVSANWGAGAASAELNVIEVIVRYVERRYFAQLDTQFN